MAAVLFVAEGRDFRFGEMFQSGKEAAARHLRPENIKQQKSQSRMLVALLGKLQEAAQPVLEARRLDQERAKRAAGPAESSAKYSPDGDPHRLVEEAARREVWSMPEMVQETLNSRAKE